MSRPEPELSAGDHAFLGMLSWGLRTAYEIKKMMQTSISFFWSAAHSQVYQQAARLVRDGYVREREEKGGRRRKILTLTPKGRRALRGWVAKPAAPLELRDEMLVKVFFAAESPDRASIATMLDGQRTTYRAVLEEFESIRAMLEAQTDERAEDQMATLRLGLRVMHAYLEWLDETIPRFEGVTAGR